MYELYADKLNQAKEENTYRTIEQSLKINILNFASSDYLGLSKNEKVLQSAFEYGKMYGCGSAASRLIEDNCGIVALEKKIAVKKNSDECLIFPSGYQANRTVIETILNRSVLGVDAVVFTDKLNHASIQKAILDSGIRFHSYRNTDLDHLELLLQKYDDKVKKYIFTETVFSMHGTQTDIDTLIKLKQKYNAFLYVDEAHSIGLHGENGYGLRNAQRNHIDVIMGTFSKALGSQGGYIACNKIIKEYIVNFCHGMIYSTGISPMIVGAASCAWNLLPELDNERLKVRETCAYMRSILKDNGILTESKSHIIPIRISNNDVMLFKRYLLDHNINTSAIRYPTVKHGEERLRVCVNALHTKENIDELIKHILKYEYNT